MNVQAETNQAEDIGLVYDQDEARVLVTIITTFNEQMECTVEGKDNSTLSLTASGQASINLANNPRPQLIKR